MTKQELMETTLDALLDSFKTSPESFELEDPTRPNLSVREFPIVLWSPKFQLNNAQQAVVADPNNKPRSVVVYYNEKTKEMCCHLFDTAPVSLNLIGALPSEASVTIKIKWPRFSRCCRKFHKLRHLLLEHDKNSQNQKFLKKLCSIFPAALDKHLLG